MSIKIIDYNGVDLYVKTGGSTITEAVEGDLQKKGYELYRNNHRERYKEAERSV